MRKDPGLKAVLDQKIRAFALKVWQLGLSGALRLACAHVLRRFLGRHVPTFATRKRDIVDTYAFVLRKSADVSAETEGSDRMVNWVIPPFSPGSGGHLNIFRMIGMLESHGYRHRIYIAGENAFTSGDEARRQIMENFVPLEAQVFLGADRMAPADFVAATSWDTVYWMKDFPACRHRLYFVQDFEPYFYARSSEFAFAEATYRMGLIGITAGQWLADLLRRDYGMQAASFGFSYEKDRYAPRPRDGGPRRVFFYARHVTPRRGFELGILALALLHQRLPDVEYVLAGWDTGEFHLPFPHLNAGVLALDELPGLYSQCDAALVLSFTNLSLLPLEVMACGCPIVSNRGPNVEWLLTDGENALLCDSTPQSVASTLERLLTDDALRRKLVRQGIEFAARTDWEEEGRRVASYLDALRTTGRLPA